MLKSPIAILQKNQTVPVFMPNPEERKIEHEGSIFPNIPRNPNAAEWQVDRVKRIDDLKTAALKRLEEACEGKYLGRVK